MKVIFFITKFLLTCQELVPIFARGSTRLLRSYSHASIEGSKHVEKSEGRGARSQTGEK